jgi:hypothetical protein
MSGSFPQVPYAARSADGATAPEAANDRHVLVYGDRAAAPVAREHDGELEDASRPVSRPAP